MAQVTSKPRETDPKMSEDKRAKEAPGGKTPRSEVQTVRFEWQSLPVGQASDILAYKNQRRQGDVAQGVQTVPAIWVPTPQSTTWQYNGLGDSVANDPPPAFMQWYGMKEVVACSGLIILLIMLLRFLEQFNVLFRLRPRRWPVQNTKVEILCKLKDKKMTTKLPSKPNDSFKKQMPPSYSKIDLNSDASPMEGVQKDLLPPYSCIFTSGKNKVPQVLFYDTRKDKEVMDKMRLSSFKDQPFRNQHMNINVPSKVDVNDPTKEMANFVIEINDTENESGCVIGMDVLVDKNHEDAVVIDDRTGIPFSITLEQLKRNDRKHTKKSNGDAKK